MAVHQVQPDTTFPSGDSHALAMLRFAPEELAQRYGLRFAEDYDDLGWFKLAAIALPDGSQAWLLRHRGNPAPGTVIYVDANADLRRAKTQLKQVLGLTDDDLVWITPLLDHPELTTNAPHASSAD